MRRGASAAPTSFVMVCRAVQSCPCHCTQTQTNARAALLTAHVFPTISQPSLTLPKRSFSLTQYRRGRLPLSQRIHLWHLMISAVLVQSHLKCPPRCWVIVTFTSTALDTLAESARLRLLIWLALDLGQDKRAR